VGQALGAGFVALGHDVMMGSRDPKTEKVAAWVARANAQKGVAAGGRASAGLFAEAAAHAEAAVLATLWAGTESAIRLAWPKNLAGKVVIDATNPLDFSQGMPPRLALGLTDSGGEQVQRWLPDALVVKAFNTVGNAHMVKPKFPGGPPDMFLCGNDAAAKETVARFCAAFGWTTIDIGGIEGARLLEPMCILWVTHGLRTNSWNHAFKLLRK
jgi:hypothetical protein